MTTYYLSPSGDDSNDGSESSPWYSFNAVDGQMAAGDTLVVLDGTYDYTTEQDINAPAGTSDNRITVRAADGANPIISFDGPDGGGWNSYADGSLSLDAEYWTIEGLTVRNSKYHGIVVKSGTNNVVIRDCTAHTNHLSGIRANDVDTVLIENCTTYGNNGSTSSGGDSDGIQLNGCSGGTIRGCTTYANADDGVDLWNSTGVLVERVDAFDNGRDGGDGNGIKAGGNDSGVDSGNNTVQRCRAWDNDASGIDWNYASQACQFYHNTSFANGGYGFEAGSGSEVINNIAYQNSTTLADDGGNITASNNTWDLGIDDPQFQSTERDAESHPTEPAKFLRLASTSAAIDSGAAITGSDTDDVGDGSPDLGAYEFDAESGASADDHNEAFDNLTVSESLIDASGTAHNGELADKSDVGDGARPSVSDDGTEVSPSPPDLNLGEFLTATLDADSSVTINAENTDTNTHITVENIDGTALLKNPDALHAGTGLEFTDDTDNTVTLNYTGGGGGDNTTVDGRPLVSTQDTTVNVPGDYNTIQAAVNNELPVILRHEFDITVDAGTYNETVVVPPYIASWVEQSADGERVPIQITGDQATPSNVQVEAFVFGAGQGTVQLRGFEFIGSSGTYDNENAHVSAYNTSRVTVVDCQSGGGAKRFLMSYNADVKANDVDAGNGQVDEFVKVKNNGQYWEQGAGEVSGHVNTVAFMLQSGTIQMNTNDQNTITAGNQLVRARDASDAGWVIDGGNNRVYGPSKYVVSDQADGNQYEIVVENGNVTTNQL